MGEKMTAMDVQFQKLPKQIAAVMQTIKQTRESRKILEVK